MGDLMRWIRKSDSRRRSQGHASLPFFLFAFLASLLVHSSYFNATTALRSQSILRNTIRDRMNSTNAAIQMFHPIPKVMCRLVGQISPDPGLSPRVCKAGMFDRSEIPLLDYNRIFAAVTICPSDICRVPENLSTDLASTGHLTGNTVGIGTTSVRFLASLRSVQINSLQIAQSSSLLIVATGNVTIRKLSVNGSGESAVSIVSTSGQVAISTSSPKIRIFAKGSQGTRLPAGVRSSSFSSEFAVSAPIIALVP